MPARGDHEARRRDVSAAVWRVLAARGFGGLTIRDIAAELDSSTGLVSHYFPSKRALVRYAHDLADERAATRVRRIPTGPGLAALRAALLDVLPLDPASVEMSRTWVSFWDAAIGDAELGTGQTARYVRWRAALTEHIVEAQTRGELPSQVDPEDIAIGCAAFAHGLVVQAVFDPERLPAARQTALLDRFLLDLARTT